MPHTTDANRFEPRTYAKVDRRLLPFLFGCYVLAYLDRVDVGFAKLQMLKDLGWSEEAFGVGAGVFFIGYFLFEVPSNLLLRRFGARRWIARIMVTWGLVCLSMIWVEGAWGFYVRRFLLGFAEAGFFPGIIYYLTLWYPSRLRAGRTALFVAAIPAAGLLGNPLSGLIMDSLSGVAGWRGWQWLFLCDGLPSVVAGVVVWFYLDNGVAEAAWLSAEEKSLIEANLAAEDAGKERARLGDALQCGQVYVLSAVYFTLMVGLYGISFWLPTIVKGFGVTGYRDTGLITAIPYAVAVAGMIVLSRYSDRTGERRRPYIWNVTAGACGLALSAVFAAHPVPAILCLSVGTLGVIGSMPLFWPMPSAILRGTAAAAGIGLVNSVGNLGGYLGPNIPVWLGRASVGPAVAMGAISGILLAGAVLAALFIPGSGVVGASTPEDPTPRRRG